MRIISHRGNINGPDPKTENHPEQIDAVLCSGLEAEIDLWYRQKAWWLGHDGPTHKVSHEWLDERMSGLWMHCKSLLSIQMALDTGTFNCFWHETDDYTLTSHGYIWTYPGTAVARPCVLVDLAAENPARTDIEGVCTDYPLKFKSAIIDAKT